MGVSVVLQTAVDSAIGMNDQAVIVDVLNILLQKPYVFRLFSGQGCLPFAQENVKMS